MQPAWERLDESDRFIFKNVFIIGEQEFESLTRGIIVDALSPSFCSDVQL